MNWRRVVLVWLLIIAAETVHGILRQLFLTPVVGDLRARQLGVVIGALLILAIAIASSRWLRAVTVRARLATGVVWVVLTLAFEVALGKLLGLTRDRMLADYDPTRGGFMILGLLFLLLAPTLGAWARRTGDRGAR